MRSSTLLKGMIQAFFACGIVNPTFGQRAHLHQQTEGLVPANNAALMNVTSVTSGKPPPTSPIDHLNSSIVSLDNNSINKTWIWLEPEAPQVIDFFSPAEFNVPSPAGNDSQVNDLFSEEDESFATHESSNINDSIGQSSPTNTTSIEDGTEVSMGRVAAFTQRPKVVFAHFMVGNAPEWTPDDWKTDIRKAQAAHIDAFALNMAADDSSNTASLNKAFSAAAELSFKFIFSFDYAGGGPWEKTIVLGYINGFAKLPAYYHYNGRPLVSTFEGWENADDWIDIKKQTNCVFIPDWSSRGAKDAVGLAGGVADGLFSWAAWPWGNTDMNTYVDASYLEFLKGKLYMMPVSPWFYTNMPGFDGKNWIWRGDSLWHDRWAQTLVVQPDFVQIISWNDYGESHYIGPLNDKSYEAFDRGLAPYNYALDMPHDGWRDLLPFAIDLYKYNTTSFTKEILVTWYRKHPINACTTGGTSGSTSSHLLIEFPPSEVAQDMIFYSALLASDAAVSVNIGGVTIRGSFQDKPSGGVGLYHGSVATNGLTGLVIVSITRSTGSLTVFGETIRSICEQDIQNYNAWVGSYSGPTIPRKSPGLAVHDMECISGTGAGVFSEICTFTCMYGYCPVSACHCLAMGKPITKPISTGVKGFPQVGMSASFEGLCNFACNLGKCPTHVCRTTQVLPYTIFTTSPFLPPVCVKGTGTGQWAGLCSYTCDFGYCPISVCSCTRQGVLNLPPPSNRENMGYPIDGPDGGMCAFACTRTWCPEDVCFRDKESGDEDIADSELLPDCTDVYHSINAIRAAGNKIPYHCFGQYMVTLQAKQLETAISDYKAIMTAGYDSKYAIYSRYIAQLVWPSIQNYIVGPGKKYLSCTELDNRICCSACQQAWCASNCRRPCGPAGQPRTIDCPSSTTFGPTDRAPPTYIFAFKDRAGFFKELADKYGIPESWTTIGEYRAFINPGCQGNLPVCFIMWRNMIRPAAKIEVPNPKTFFANSLNDLTELQKSLVNNAVAEGLELGSASATNMVDVASLPVAMAVEAVVNMRAVVVKANEIKEEERKSMILFFVTSMLMFVPVLGTGAAALGWTALRSIILMAGTAGEAALGIYSIIEDPTNALFAIFSALFVTRDFGRAARARDRMEDRDINALGLNVATSMKSTSKTKRDFVCKI